MRIDHSHKSRILYYCTSSFRYCSWTRVLNLSRSFHTTENNALLLEVFPVEEPPHIDPSKKWCPFLWLYPVRVLTRNPVPPRNPFQARNDFARSITMVLPLSTRKVQVYRRRAERDSKERAVIKLALIHALPASVWFFILWWKRSKKSKQLHSSSGNILCNEACSAQLRQQLVCDATNDRTRNLPGAPVLAELLIKVRALRFWRSDWRENHQTQVCYFIRMKLRGTQLRIAVMQIFVG